MKHVDLYSGIGGFSLACDWLGIETVCFCEMDKFCQKVLAKHWPRVPIVEDVNNVEEIRRIVTDAQSGYAGRTSRAILQAYELKTEERPQGRDAELSNADRIRFTTNARLFGQAKQELQATGVKQYCGVAANTANGRCTQLLRENESTGDESGELLLTAGFPCQPFSNAGRKRGANDHRYLWPQTLAVIESVKPDYVLLENVAGLLNMVFPDSESGVASQASIFGNPNDEIADYRTICGGIERDLRQAGYETVWFVIPACSLGAPHRRDRVWIVAHSIGTGAWSDNREAGNERGRTGEDRREGIRQDNGQTSENQQSGDGWQFGISEGDSVASNATNSGQQGERRQPKPITKTERIISNDRTIPGWQENWYEVATRFCRIHDGVPNRVDRLKSLGNAIVPQIACEVIKAMINPSKKLWSKS